MTDSEKNWLADKLENGWDMPSAPRWKRLPIIRHVRATYHSWRVYRHEALWRSVGMVPSGYDRWIVYGMARGWERDE